MEKATCAPRNPVMTSAKSLTAKEQLNSAVAVNATLTLQMYTSRSTRSQYFSASPKKLLHVFTIFFRSAYIPDCGSSKFLIINSETFFFRFIVIYFSFAFFLQNSFIHF